MTTLRRSQPTRPLVFEAPIPESVEFANELARRCDEVVFVARDADGAAALREFGLLAVARPEGGAWDCAASGPLLDRDVVIVRTQPYGYAEEWCDRDRTRLSPTVRRIGVYTPIDFENERPPADLAEFVGRQRRLAIGPAFLVREAMASLVDQMPRVEPPDPTAEATDSPVDAGPWPDDPKPVRYELRPVPALQPEMIPEPLRGWLADIAERVSCALDFPVVAALVALAIVLGSKVAIRPKRHDDWTVVLNLWGAVIGRPGVMKTPALTEATKPLRRLEADARSRHKAALEEFQAESLVAAVRAESAKKSLKDAAKEGKPKEILDSLAREATQAAAPVAPSLRRYTTSDPTVEALGELLRDNPGGIGLIRDELTGWLRSFDKDGRECDRAFYLEAWNGNGPAFTYDRISRGTIIIPSPCVSILGGMQPGPLRSLLRRVARGQEADDGLISRFQLIVWPDSSAEWRNVDRWPDTAQKNRAYAVFQWLNSLSPADIGAAPDDDGGPPFLRFDPEAQDLFDSWRATLEAKVRAPDESPLIESHLSKYRSLMPSLAALLHLIDAADGAGAGPVTVRAAELAAQWCVYLESLARRIYECVADPELEPARALSERIKQAALPSPFAYRDVYRRGWSNLDTPDAARRAVTVLEDLGWVRTVETRETGGAPRLDIHIHPKLPRKALENP